MKLVLTHYVVMEKYVVPDEVAEKGNDAIEQYIYENDLRPIKEDGRDWEVVDWEVVDVEDYDG